MNIIYPQPDKLCVVPFILWLPMIQTGLYNVLQSGVAVEGRCIIIYTSKYYIFTGKYTGKLPGKVPSKYTGKVPGKVPSKYTGKLPGKVPVNILGKSPVESQVESQVNILGKLVLWYIR